MIRILVIEDDRWLGDSYERILHAHNFSVLRAEDASIAMELVEEEKPDVIIADIMLEGHTVFTLLHELQSYDDTRAIPVILCSNVSTDVIDTTDSEQYGIRRMLDKATLEPSVLVSVVDEVVA